MAISGPMAGAVVVAALLASASGIDGCLAMMHVAVPGDPVARGPAPRTAIASRSVPYPACSWPRILLHLSVYTRECNTNSQATPFAGEVRDSWPSRTNPSIKRSRQKLSLPHERNDLPHNEMISLGKPFRAIYCDLRRDRDPDCRAEHDDRVRVPAAGNPHNLVKPWTCPLFWGVKLYFVSIGTFERTARRETHTQAAVYVTTADGGCTARVAGPAAQTSTPTRRLRGRASRTTCGTTTTARARATRGTRCSTRGWSPGATSSPSTSIRLAGGSP